MKKRILVLVLVFVFTIFASSTAFAVVQEEPIELKEGEMAITSVEGESTYPNEPVTNQPDDLKRTNDPINPPDPTKTDEELSATSVPIDATEEDVRVIMSPPSSGAPEMAQSGVAEMAQTGVVEDAKKDNNTLYLAAVGVILAVTGVIFFRRKRSTK